MELLKLFISIIFGKEPEKSERQKLPIPQNAVLADEKKLIDHVHRMDMPLYYLDREFVCRDCGSNEVWKAKQQKWWYEEAGGYFFSGVIRCRACRDKERNRKREARKIYLDGLQN